MVKHYTPRQHQQDLRIVKDVDGQEINLYDYFEDADRKRTILRGIGYRGLRVASNGSGEPFIPLENCNDERVSAVLIERYDTAKRRLNEYNAGERIFRKPKEKKPVKEILQKPIEKSVERKGIERELTEQLRLF